MKPQLCYDLMDALIDLVVMAENGNVVLGTAEKTNTYTMSQWNSSVRRGREILNAIKEDKNV